MKRREFFKLVGGVAAGWPLVALAQQQAAKLPRIGSISTEPSELGEASSQGLRRADGSRAWHARGATLPDFFWIFLI
jgi:hypothetical protein